MPFFLIIQRISSLWNLTSWIIFLKAWKEFSFQVLMRQTCFFSFKPVIDISWHEFIASLKELLNPRDESFYKKIFKTHLQLLNFSNLWKTICFPVDAHMPKSFQEHSLAEYYNKNCIKNFFFLQDPRILRLSQCDFSIARLHKRNSNNNNGALSDVSPFNCSRKKKRMKYLVKIQKQFLAKESFVTYIPLELQLRASYM